MTAAVRTAIPSTPTLRNAAGEPPLGPGGLAFRDDQGEMFLHDNPRYRSPASRLGVLELESGKWLALPPGFHTDAPQFDSREQALRTAIARMIRRARRFMSAKQGEGTHWTEGYAGRVIDWAFSVKPEKRISLDLKSEYEALAAINCGEWVFPADRDELIARGLVERVAGNPGIYQLNEQGEDRRLSLLPKFTPDWNGGLVVEEIIPAVHVTKDLAAESPSEEITPAAAERDYWIYADDDTVQLTKDPIVRFLAEAHQMRRAFPAKHPFSMTNPIEDGRILILATCKCGHVVKFGAGDQLRVDAAIEAHWCRRDYEPKIDGRGVPIKPGDGSRIPSAKKQRKKSIKSSDGGVEMQTRATPLEQSLGVRQVGSSTLQLPAGAAPGPSEADPGAGGLLAPDVADAPQSSRQEPAPIECPGGAGSPSVAEAAPIGAPDFATTMAAAPAEDWDPLLRAALDLAWREPPQVTASLAALLDFSKVYAISGEVERPPLRWHGGKWKLAPWIISHFPEHRIYVEPFGGGASVLLRKRRTLSEVYNDLDEEVVNFFRVLRSRDAAKLIEALRLTPFARAEFDEAFCAMDEPVERARRLVVRSHMAGGSRGVLDLDRTMAGFNGGSARSRGDNPNSSHARDWSNYVDTLPAVITRLTEVIIENRPATELLKQHDGADTLFYVDPPYIAATRSDRARKAYRHELDDEGHAVLLKELRSLSGMVILSGYCSELYDIALSDWRRVEIAAHADGARPRTEVLWLNPACSAALDRQYPALFDLAAFDAANTPPTDMMEAEA